ncbi:DUF4386 domain-containing protein [Modestobacter versicolor]|uniref:DUF4386 domain-containing protein n=1 Tax=Modestobacter versicolor TaxID=429133 RepID=A0A323V833_9ACTN|nr:DUF4386 domain-containing protein [Modestobacter versicolor]MBB3677542.1 hypothetical protein [Modestobacter versicolor]PZA20987.1 DUF4386 domain-containing protein [Modestobacter versicolor]
MRSTRTTAVVTGVFFVVAAVAAVIGLALYAPVLDDPGYVLGGGADTRVLLGGFFEAVLVASVIGTGVALYPVLREHGPGLALGYAAGRTLEAAVIAVGIVSLLAVVTLRQDAAAGSGADADALVTAARALVAVHDWTFLVGPGLVIGVNSLLLAVLVYRSRLVPRPIAVLGLVGGPLVFASSTAVLFGAYEQLSALGGLAAVPVAAWEMALAGWLIVKGFRPAEVPQPPRQPAFS